MRANEPGGGIHERIDCRLEVVGLGTAASQPAADRPGLRLHQRRHDEDVWRSHRHAWRRPGAGTVALWSQMWIGAVLEIVGGTLLLVGLFTRPVAFVLAGEMAVAYFQFHFPTSFWPTVNQGMPAVLYS